MKIVSIFLGSALWAIALPALQASECDSKGSCDKWNCSPVPRCTDSGLLDAVDQFAGRLHLGISRFTRSMQAGFRTDSSFRTNSACDSYCDSCPATEGWLERLGRSRGSQCDSRSECDSCPQGDNCSQGDTRSQCDSCPQGGSCPQCDSCQSEGNEAIDEATSNPPSPLSAAPQSSNKLLNGSAVTDPSGQGRSVQRLSPLPGSTGIGGATGSSNLRQIPTRLRKPDSQSDPFQDDSQTNLNPLPERVNRYEQLSPMNVRGPKSLPRPAYDSQASSDAATSGYWSGSDPASSLPKAAVATASNESSVESAEVRKPYRVSVGDPDDALEIIPMSVLKKSANPFRQGQSSDTTKPVDRQAPPSKATPTNPLR